MMNSPCVPIQKLSANTAGCRATEAWTCPPRADAQASAAGDQLHPRMRWRPQSQPHRRPAGTGRGTADCWADAASIHKQQRRRRRRQLFDFPTPTFFVFPHANRSVQELFDLFWQRGKSSFVSLSYLGAREASIGIWALWLERAEVKPGDKHLIGICMGEESCDTTTFPYVPAARWGSTIDPCGGRVGRIWAELQTGRGGADGCDTWQAITDNYWAAFKGPHTGRKKKKTQTPQPRLIEHRAVRAVGYFALFTFYSATSNPGRIYSTLMNFSSKTCEHSAPPHLSWRCCSFYTQCWYFSCEHIYSNRQRAWR